MEARDHDLQGGNAMAVVRPYLSLKIEDLESLFEAVSSDKIVCEALLEELTYRTTDRAATLRGRVKNALASPTRTIPSDAAPGDATKRPGRQPGIANKPTAILDAWTAIEALSPQTYRYPADLANGDKQCIVDILNGELPWFRRAPPRPKYRLYYQIVLGSVPMDKATDALIRVFGDHEERSRKEREKAALAAIIVDQKGLLAEGDAISISSFGWALPIALQGELSGLGAWTSVEKDFVAGVARHLTRNDEEGKPLPLDRDTIYRAFRWLVEALNLPDHLYEEPTFVVRVYQHEKSKGHPEPTLLNSFFLPDLARARNVSSTVAALSRYLGGERVDRSADLLTHTSLIEQLLAPDNTPLARWPSPGGHPLVTLQQAAVNGARSELSGSGGGIASVNGPPGTGKTTLLRDIVASCILDRASAMAQMDDPASAFSSTGQKIAAGSSAFFKFHGLHESLKGHEILVASSNNKAVENVSRELPSAKSVGRDIAYLRTVAERLQRGRNDSGDPASNEPAWGLMAAVLGNASNRNSFQQAIWWDDDRSLRLYLKAAKGDSVLREVKGADGRVIGSELPTVVSAEAPPTPEQAKANWRDARERFLSLRAAVKAEMDALEAVRQDCLKLGPARANILIATSKWKEASRSAETAPQDAARALTALEEWTRTLEAARRHASLIESQLPPWWHRLFNTLQMRRWRDARNEAVSNRADAEGRVTLAGHAYNEAHLRHSQAEARIRASAEALTRAKDALARIEEVISDHRNRLGPRLVDESFFQKDHAQWNLASPWISSDLHGRREDLFAAALELHRAFIDCAAQKISHNLGILMGAMQAGALQDKAKRDLLPDLWSTLFLVCPVISTTFASVGRMLGDMPQRSIGWLLIDEAGQATPQSAVGALMRARRAIVVGDPLQIPPVVSLPERMVIDIARHFGVDHEIWMAPGASAQTLADQASRWTAAFRGDVGHREVGIPLLVHRRCQEPMFGISNRIAYDGQMVFSAGNPQPGSVTKAIGRSRWLHVDGEAQSKWCPEEGEVVVALLRILAKASVRQPDIYIITPFRIVANELRRRIEQESELLAALGVEAREWCRDRVGTIHTFQGKEAEAVIAVLGAPAATQHGARYWAGSTPNVFNVMVSRAKQGLYIVGSHAAWSSVGHGRELAASLPVCDATTELWAGGDALMG